MVSGTHDNYQIMASKEITHASSSSKKTYGISTTESLSAKQYTLSKANKDDNVKNKVVDAIVLDNNNQLSHIEEKVNICDTCGDLGWERLLVICGICKIHAQHTYCMIKKVYKVPDKWSCYDCTKDQDKMREREDTEETSSRKRKAESFVDSFEVIEKRRRLCLLNMDHNKDLKEEANIYLFGVNLTKRANTYLFGVDLNKDPNTDLNHDPNTKMNMGPTSRFP